MTHNGAWECPKYSNIFYYKDGEVTKNETECNLIVLSIVSLCAKIAKADGVVTNNEITVVNNILIDVFELNKSQLKQAADRFNLAKKSCHDYYSYINYIKNVVSSNQKMNMQSSGIYKQVIEIMYAVAAADNSVSNEQQKIIDCAALKFNLKSEEQEIIKNKYVKDLDKYYKILNCTSNSSNTEIKSSYRKLLLEYHPDKFYSKNLPQEMMNFAKEKTLQIQNAYEIIRKERKI